LLDRVERTVVRERRFTADVAHELRTPLAGLTATLDVCAARRRAPEDYERTVERCSAIVWSMSAMVENLLTLARADARQLAVRPARASVAALVDECWAAFDAAAVGRGITAEFRFDDDLVVETDTEKLRIVLNNLLDNAVSHTDTGGWVRVGGRATDGGVELRFANSGSGVARHEAGRVFDRFWRGDVGRGATGVHCGLGLSLCREVTTLLGGTIEATSEAGEVFKVRLVLPGGAGLARQVVTDHAGTGGAYPERRAAGDAPAVHAATHSAPDSIDA
jgi:signal transduction histidine kinase